MSFRQLRLVVRCSGFLRCRFGQAHSKGVVGQQLLQLVAQAVLHAAQLRHFVALIPDLQVRGGDRLAKDDAQLAEKVQPAVLGTVDDAHRRRRRSQMHRS